MYIAISLVALSTPWIHYISGKSFTEISPPEHLLPIFSPIKWSSRIIVFQVFSEKFPTHHPSTSKSTADPWDEGVLTLPETKSLHPNMDAWNANIPFRPHRFFRVPWNRARHLGLRNDSMTGALVQDPSFANHMRIEIERPLLQLRQWHGQTKRGRECGQMTSNIFVPLSKSFPSTKGSE